MQIALSAMKKGTRFFFIRSCVLDESRKVDRNQSMQDYSSHVKDSDFYPKRNGNLLMGFMQKSNMFVC